VIVKMGGEPLNIVDTLKNSLWEAAEKRRIAASYRATWRDRRCPSCGNGLKIRHIMGRTIMVCPGDPLRPDLRGCSWYLMVPFEMDEGRDCEEAYTPGVTGQVRGTPVVKVKADGSMEILRP
jgi:hypothetical protein